MAGVAEGAGDSGTGFVEPALKLSEVCWYEAGRHLLGLIVIKIIHGRNAGDVAEAGEPVVEVEQVGVVAAVDNLPVSGCLPELGAAWVKVGSRVARIGIEKVGAGDQLTYNVGGIGALDTGCAVSVSAQI
ncbi:MAG TPA: hypothetical protein DD490_23495 [Acidobacteria bacterium]|nr:hypothetical protein [Acidobacteriota bacterium]